MRNTVSTTTFLLCVAFDLYHLDPWCRKPRRVTNHGGVTDLDIAKIWVQIPVQSLSHCGTLWIDLSSLSLSWYHCAHYVFRQVYHTQLGGWHRVGAAYIGSVFFPFPFPEYNPAWVFLGASKLMRYFTFTPYCVILSNSPSAPESWF